MGRVRNPPHFHRMQNSWSFAKVFRGSTSVLYREPKLLKGRYRASVRSAAHRHLFHRSAARKVKLMTGCFLLQRPIARRPTLAGRSAARGISTGVTSRGTPGRTRQVGQPVCAQVARRIAIPIHLQPARLTVKHPLGKGKRGTDPATARAPLRGREVPRRNEEHTRRTYIPASAGRLPIPHPEWPARDSRSALRSGPPPPEPAWLSPARW